MLTCHPTALYLYAALYPSEREGFFLSSLGRGTGHVCCSQLCTKQQLRVVLISEILGMDAGKHPNRMAESGVIGKNALPPFLNQGGVQVLDFCASN